MQTVLRRCIREMIQGPLYFSCLQSHYLRASLFMACSEQHTYGWLGLVLIPMSRIHMRSHQNPWFISVWQLPVVIFFCLSVYAFSSVLFVDEAYLKWKRNENSQDTVEMQVKILQEGFWQTRVGYNVLSLPRKLQKVC